jgi:hypothetical protein
MFDPDRAAAHDEDRPARRIRVSFHELTAADAAKREECRGRVDDGVRNAGEERRSAQAIKRSRDDLVAEKFVLESGSRHGLFGKHRLGMLTRRLVPSRVRAYQKSIEVQIEST